MQPIYSVQARWDTEGGVWVAESEDVPGLVAEAESPNELSKKLRVLIPELLELNRALPPDSKPVEFVVHYKHEESVVAPLVS